jgi:hypothetical protein
MPSAFRVYPLFGILLSLLMQAALPGRTEKPVAASGAQVSDSAIQVTEVTVDAAEIVAGKSAYAEVHEFRENQNQDLRPAAKFMVNCAVKAKTTSNSEELIVWTTIDFIVAPATPANERLSINELAAEVSWGQITEMQDVESTVLDGFDSSEPTHIVFSESNRGPVLAAFPLGNAGNLWPWLMRVNIHVQDRNGKPVAQAERIVRLWPSATRLKNKTHASGL